MMLLMIGVLMPQLPAKADTAVFDCGGAVAAGQRAVLQNDVACDFRCSGDPSILCGYLDEDTCLGHGVCEPDYVELAVGATLDLNGFTIDAAYQAAAVVCGQSDADRGRCVVRGPGLIRGGKGSAVYGRAIDVVLRNVTVGGFDQSIFTRGRVIAKGLRVLDDRENSVYGGSGVMLRNVAMDGEHAIQSGGDMLIDNVVLGPHSGRLEALGTIYGRDLTIIGSRTIEGKDIRLRRVTAAPDDSGSMHSRLRAERRLRLVDSDVAVIEAGRLPHLVHSTCEESVVTDSTATWGLCAGD